MMLTGAVQHWIVEEEWVGKVGWLTVLGGDDWAIAKPIFSNLVSLFASLFSKQIQENWSILLLSDAVVG